MTKEEILKEARSRVQRAGFTMPEENMDYIMHKCEQCKKMMCQLMKTDFPYAKITYDVIVNKTTFRNYMVDTVSAKSDMTPHELNIARVQALERANKRMTDIPYEGFEPYAIVKFEYTLKVYDTSVNTLNHAIEERNGLYGFLWFDFDEPQTEDSMPIIKW
jgi:hypothetical protein